MIFQALYAGPWSVVMAWINTLPVISTGQLPTGWQADLANMIRIGVAFVPADIIMVSISTVLLWGGVYFAIGLFRFVKSVVPFA